MEDVSDRQLLEVIAEQNQQLIEQHNKVIELLSTAIEQVNPALDALSKSPVAKMLGVRIPAVKVGNDE